MSKSSELFNEWYSSQPAANLRYIKTRCMEELGWNEAKFHNKLTRTALTTPEQRILNTIFNERIFEVPEIPVIQG